MSEGRYILLERLGEVARITLNRPEQLNAFTPQMVQDLVTILRRAVEEGARAVILTGAGRAFSSGADLAPNTGPKIDAGQRLREYNALPLALADLPVPVVTAINGAAAGGGASLALAGDIILAARSAYLMLAFAKVALVPDLGATWLVAHAAGRVKALEMALLGERLSAEAALQAGLVTRVVDDEALTATAEEIAARLAAMPTVTLGLIRRQVRLALETSLAESLEVEADNQRISAASEDFKEGTAAFREKRKPKFVGR
jgi:2-(1,2-epoxy-1,2-dihydrophenyl)acetyl-CoA isomerase